MRFYSVSFFCFTALDIWYQDSGRGHGPITADPIPRLCIHAKSSTAAEYKRQTFTPGSNQFSGWCCSEPMLHSTWPGKSAASCNPGHAPSFFYTVLSLACCEPVWHTLVPAAPFIYETSDSGPVPEPVSYTVPVMMGIHKKSIFLFWEKNKQTLKCEWTTALLHLWKGSYSLKIQKIRLNKSEFWLI